MYKMYMVKRRSIVVKSQSPLHTIYGTRVYRGIPSIYHNRIPLVQYTGAFERAFDHRQRATDRRGCLAPPRIAHYNNILCTCHDGVHIVLCVLPFCPVSACRRAQTDYAKLALCYSARRYRAREICETARGVNRDAISQPAGTLRVMARAAHGRE